jgi:GNAT superfamily N-acetyltransferase
MAELAALDFLDADGLVGAVAQGSTPRGGLVLMHEGAGPLLRDVLADHTPQWVGLLTPALPLLPDVVAAGWDISEDHRMMSLSDLEQLNSSPMPCGTSIREVAVRGEQGGFPLVAALRVQLEHSRSEEAAPARELELEARLIRTLSGIRLFAALGPDGTCVGTAGSRIVDESALVAGVVTIPTARRRGLGTAMTSHALTAAREGGAKNAFLDATAAGVGIYLRLGFRDLGPIVYCERSVARREAT